METRDYKYFIHLADTLHFGRSAADLHISPSALTRSVQRMEEEVGQPLLLRDQRHVSLTPAGERFRRFAKEQLARWDALQAEFSQEAASPSGELRIASTVTACYSVLPSLLARCRATFPRIAIKLNTQDAARSMRQLETAEVDVAVVPLPDALAEGYASIELGHTDLVFIAPVQPTEWSALLTRSSIPWAQVPLVAPLRGLERERLDTWLAQRNAEPSVYAEVRGNEGIIAMVSMGFGIGLVPELVLERSPQATAVRRVPELMPPRGYQVGLCARRWALKTPAVAAFWDLASQQA